MSRDGNNCYKQVKKNLKRPDQRVRCIVVTIVVVKYERKTDYMSYHFLIFAVN